MVIGVGLLLALAATAGPLPSPGDGPGGSLAVRLPDAVRVTVLALLGLSAILLLALQRPRRPTEDDPLGARAPQRRRTSLILTLLPIGVLLAAAWYFVWNRWSGEQHHPIERALTALAGLLDIIAQYRKPATSVAFFDLTIALLLLLFALALFALMVLVALADRLEKWWAARTRRRRAGAPRPPLDERDDDPRAEADPRRAIVRAYARFEHALAAARAPRSPWQTPAEFMRTTLVRLPVPAAPVRRLTALFELARFSDRPLGGRSPRRRLRLPGRDHHRARRRGRPVPADRALGRVVVRSAMLGGVVLLVTVPVYVYVEPSWRSLVARLACAFVLGVALLQFRRALLDRLAARGASPLDAARGRRRARTRRPAPLRGPGQRRAHRAAQPPLLRQGPVAAPGRADASPAGCARTLDRGAAPAWRACDG